MAFERVTLYGVPLVADRPVNFGSIDPALARELFIRHALVYGEWSQLTSGRHRFYEKNLRLLQEAEELEHRARRRDIVVDEHTLFDFYDARVGAEVVSGAHFDQWWKQTRREQPELLTFDPAMLTHDTAGQIREADYPETWQSGAGEGLTFPISYHFEPGAADDGLTIDVPVATLNRVAADDFSWNVPGLREELVTGLIRSLPKHLRVNFVPAPNRAREFLAAVPAGEEPLLDALERYFRSSTGVVVPREAWDWTRVPEHLRPTYRVVDDNGREQARGKDLEALKEPLRPKFAAGDRRGRGRQRDHPHRRDRLGVRHRRGLLHAEARRPRGPRLPRPRRRGRDGRAAGLRVGVRAGGAAPAGRPPAPAADDAVAGQAGARRPRQRPEARARRFAVRQRGGAARGRPGRGRRRGRGRPPAGARRGGVRRPAGRGGRRPGGAPARGDGRRAHRPRCLAPGREGAERSRRHARCCRRCPT